LRISNYALTVLKTHIKNKEITDSSTESKNMKPQRCGEQKDEPPAVEKRNPRHGSGG